MFGIKYNSYIHLMLENVFYINLKHRKDRKRHVEKELKKLAEDFANELDFYDFKK